MTFGENFKNIRIECGFTQQQVAAMLNIAQSNISDWENDISRPEYENLLKLRKIYDVTLNELLGVRED